MRTAWNSLIDAVAAVVGIRLGSRPVRIRVSPLSADWLRRHEIDARKHDAVL